jgi:hypothetical protein
MTQAQRSARTIGEAIERGTTRVEEAHRAIADIPFDVLQRNGLFEETAGDLRQIHHRTLGAIYDGIRNVTRTLGEMTSDLLDDVTDELDRSGERS